MHRSLVVAALAALSLVAGSRVVRGQDAPKPKPAESAPAAEEAIPDDAPRAPLPADPSAELKKRIQHAVKAWFDFEPRIPDKARSALQIKGDRAGAQGALSKAVQDWDALIPPNHCLRAIAWWKARFDETQPSESRPTGIQKVDFVTRNDNGKDFTYPLVVSIPTVYRANKPDVYPVIVTIIDKEMAADPKKNLTAVYGKLLDTHVVVASVESNLKGPGDVLQSLYYVHFNYRIDRDRVTLDAVGKGTRFVERLSTGEVFCLQWNGVVFRNPVMTSPLAGNLDLNPCAVVEAAQPSGPAASALTVIKSNCSKLELIPEGPDASQKVRDWMATLGTRKIADPRNDYTLWFASSGGMPKWGYWFQVDEAYDSGIEAPIVRVGYSVVPGKNLVEIYGKNLSRASILLNDEALDLDQTIFVRGNGIVVAREKVVRNLGITTDAMGGFATTPLAARNYIVTAMLPFSLTGDALTPKAERDAADEAIREAERKRLKEEELARQAEEERKRAEEEAKNPKPADANGGVPEPAAEAKWLATLDEAKAAAGGKPVLVVFGAAPDAPLQKAVDAALGSDEAKKRMAGSVGVRFGPAAVGDAGKPTRDALALVSGKADAQAPWLAVVEWVVPAAAPPEGNPADGKPPEPAPPALRLKKGLDVAPLKEEDVKPGVLDLIESLAPLPAPAKEPEKPAAEGDRKDAPPPTEPPKNDPPKQDPPKEEPPKENSPQENPPKK